MEDSNKFLKHLQDAGYVSTTFQSYRNSLHIDVGFDKTVTELSLDTGTWHTTITESFGKKLGLTTNAPGREIHVRGAFGESTRTEWDVRIDKFALGPVRARNLPAKVMAGSYGMVNGLLGMDTLVRFGAIVDFRVGVIHLRRSGIPEIEIDSFLEKLGYLQIKLTKHQFASITIENKTGWTLIDSGAASSIINKSFIRSLKLPTLVGDKLQVSDVRSESKQLEPMKIKKLKIGDHSIPDLIVGVTELDEERLPTPFAGLLGSEFLTAHRAILDCERGHLYLAKNPGKVSALRNAQ